MAVVLVDLVVVEFQDLVELVLVGLAELVGSQGLVGSQELVGFQDLVVAVYQDLVVLELAVLAVEAVIVA